MNHFLFASALPVETHFVIKNLVILRNVSRNVPNVLAQYEFQDEEFTYLEREV